MRWLKEAEEGNIFVGGNGLRVQPNQFRGPTDLSFDLENNLYVVDRGNENRSRGMKYLRRKDFVFVMKNRKV
jgi:hypothetical protein